MISPLLKRFEQLIKKMKRKKIIAIAAAVIVVIAYILISGREKNNRESVAVMRGDISREIFEAGTIKRGEEIMLSFGVPGTVLNIAVAEGEDVSVGQTIAVLNRKSLELELDKAGDALRLTEIEFQKLSAGGSDADVRLAQIVAENARTALSSATRNLEKVKETERERLRGAYDGAIPSLADAILVADSAHKTAKRVSQIHFSGFFSPEVRSALEARDRIGQTLDDILRRRGEIRGAEDQKGIDLALLTADLGLKNIIGELDLIRKVLERDPYRHVSQAEITLLFSEMASVNRSSSVIVSLRSSISAAKLTGEGNILAAEAAKNSAEGALAQAERGLSMTISPARSEEIQLAKVRMSQARSNLQIVRKKLDEAEIRSPFDGRVLKIDIRPGEFVQPGAPAVLVVPNAPFQTEVQIYEGEIAGIRIGNPVKIEIVAFPDRAFNGEIVFIGQASEIVDGVVTYRVLTSINDYPEGIMFGMTADVTIVPEKRENVLYLPDSAIADGTVLLIKNGEVLEVKVETGLIGFDGNVEIISGLNEGDRVIASR